MSAEVEEKKDLIETLLGSAGIPEGILEYGFVGILPFALMVIIGWLIKDYYKESREIFLKGRYLEFDERTPLNETNNGDQFQHELNLSYFSPKKIFWAIILGKPFAILMSVGVVTGACIIIYNHSGVAFYFLLYHAVNVAELIHPEGIKRSDIFSCFLNFLFSPVIR